MDAKMFVYFLIIFLTVITINSNEGQLCEKFNKSKISHIASVIPGINHPGSYAEPEINVRNRPKLTIYGHKICFMKTDK